MSQGQMKVPTVAGSPQPIATPPADTQSAPAPAASAITLADITGAVPLSEVEAYIARRTAELGAEAREEARRKAAAEEEEKERQNREAHKQLLASTIAQIRTAAVARGVLEEQLRDLRHQLNALAYEAPFAEQDAEVARQLFLKQLAEFQRLSADAAQASSDEGDANSELEQVSSQLKASVQLYRQLTAPKDTKLYLGEGADAMNAAHAQARDALSGVAVESVEDIVFWLSRDDEAELEQAPIADNKDLMIAHLEADLQAVSQRATAAEEELEALRAAADSAPDPADPAPADDNEAEMLRRQAYREWLTKGRLYKAFHPWTDPIPDGV